MTSFSSSCLCLSRLYARARAYSRRGILLREWKITNGVVVASSRLIWPVFWVIPFLLRLRVEGDTPFFCWERLGVGGIPVTLIFSLKSFDRNMRRGSSRLPLFFEVVLALSICDVAKVLMDRSLRFLWIAYICLRMSGCATFFNNSGGEAERNILTHRANKICRPIVKMWRYSVGYLRNAKLIFIA